MPIRCCRHRFLKHETYCPCWRARTELFRRHSRSRPPGSRRRPAIAAGRRRSLYLSLPLAKNPTDRPSGDQKGYCPPSVPASGRAEVESSGRAHNCGPRGPSPLNTRVRPSGEIANDASVAVPGVVISSRVSGASGAGVTPHLTAPAAVAATTASNAQAIRSRPMPRRDSPMTASVETCCASAMSRRASPMCCRRCRLSFWRQRRRVI